MGIPMRHWDLESKRIQWMSEWASFPKRAVISHSCHSNWDSFLNLPATKKWISGCPKHGMETFCFVKRNIFIIKWGIFEVRCAQLSKLFSIFNQTMFSKQWPLTRWIKPTKMTPLSPTKWTGKCKFLLFFAGAKYHIPADVPYMRYSKDDKNDAQSCSDCLIHAACCLFSLRRYFVSFVIQFQFHEGKSI